MGDTSTHQCHTHQLHWYPSLCTDTPISHGIPAFAHRPPVFANTGDESGGRCAAQARQCR